VVPIALRGFQERSNTNSSELSPGGRDRHNKVGRPTAPLFPRQERFIDGCVKRVRGNATHHLHKLHELLVERGRDNVDLAVEQAALVGPFLLRLVRQACRRIPTLAPVQSGHEQRSLKGVLGPCRLRCRSWPSSVERSGAGRDNRKSARSPSDATGDGRRLNVP
jgi:hypothetical protein